MPLEEGRGGGGRPSAGYPNTNTAIYIGLTQIEDLVAHRAVIHQTPVIYIANLYKYQPPL